MKTAAELYADPEIFLAVDDLELVGRGIADSVWYGLHRSHLRGPGVEFETHREYRSGDDLRQVNWAVFARQRRLFTRESRRETRRPVYLLLDATGSMNVANGPWAKADYARRMLAALAFLAIRQGDAPALGVLRDSLVSFLPPRSGTSQALAICAELARSEATGEGDLPAALARWHPFSRKRGFIVLVSDFFDREDEVLSELTAYRAQGHDVLALQILDPFEEEIPRAGDFQFIDTETGSHFRTSAEPLFAAHAERVSSWRESLRKRAERQGIGWESVTTRASLVETAYRWFGERGVS